MNSADDKKIASALTALLRAALRDAGFSLTHLAPTNTELARGSNGGATTTNFEETINEELDAHGLRVLHRQGAWKRKSSWSNVRLKALPQGVESAARLEAFERLLDAFGVLSEGHLAHAITAVLHAHGSSTAFDADSPVRSVGVCATSDLWSYLLVDACLTTPRRTANKLLRWARGAPLAFETCAILGRLNAASSFSLANGLAVERLPRRSAHLNGWFPTGSGVALSDYLDRTILRIPCKIAPVLSKPSKTTEHHSGKPVVVWKAPATVEASWPLPHGGVLELGPALSLACDVAVETPMTWTDYGDHAHFGQHLSTSRFGSGELPPRTDTDPTLTVDRLKEALRLQPKMRNMPDSIETAFRYWLKSKERRPDLADRLVFLRSALEALFLDSGNRAELTFRLATNGAWYTGRNPAERRQRYNTLKDVYAAGSGAVHTGRVKDTAEKLLTDGQEICRLAIQKRLRSTQDPVWEDIVFGR